MRRSLFLLLPFAALAGFPVFGAERRADARSADGGAVEGRRISVSEDWIAPLDGLLASEAFGRISLQEAVPVLRNIDLRDAEARAGLAEVVAILSRDGYGPEFFAGPANREEQVRRFEAALESYLGAGKDRPEKLLALAPEPAAPAPKLPLMARLLPSRAKRGGDVLTAEKFKRLPQKDKVRTFRALTPAQRGALLLEPGMSDDDLALWMNLPSPQEAAELIRQVPDEKARGRLMDSLEEKAHKQVTALLAYAEDEAGGLMDPRFVRVPSHLNVDEAKSYVITELERRELERRTAGNVIEEDIRLIYVLDKHQHLEKVVALSKLLGSSGDGSILELAYSPAVIIRNDMKQEQVVKLFLRHKPGSAPVLDADGRLVGVLHAKDVVPVMHEAAEEGIAKMSGLQKLRLLTATPFQMARTRTPWLAVTWGIETFVVAAILQTFTPHLPTAVALSLTALIPSIAAMGGNVGAQTATWIVRGLATGELERKDMWPAFRKELTTGMLLGFLFGLGIAGFAYLSPYLTHLLPFMTPIYPNWKIAFVAGAGMFFSMTAASAMGSLEPFLFQRMGIDPATAMGPLITSFTDLVSNTAYLALALWMFL